MRIQHSITPSAQARNVARGETGPTAKHPEREAPPDAIGGRPIQQGRETDAAKEEAEWERLAASSSIGAFRSGAGTGAGKMEGHEEGDEGPDEDSDDEFTGGLMPSHGAEGEDEGRERYKVRYLIGKALHREAMRERDALEKELDGCRKELKRSWEWKEQALDAVLRRDLG